MKTWLITGCSSGLGRGIAKAVLRRGDWAAVTARDPADLNTLAQAYPERVLPLRLDLTDRESMEQAVHEICQHFGSIDVLVNNAGHGYPDRGGSFVETYYIRDADMNLAKIPDGVALEQAVMVPDMMCTAFEGVQALNMRFGQSVAVLGVGPVGLMAVRAAVLQGAGNVFAIGSRQVCFDVAREYGATHLIDYHNEDYIDQILRENDGPVDNVVLCGGSEKELSLGLKMLKNGGTLVNLSAYFSNASIPIQPAVWGFGYGDKTIKGVGCGGGRLLLSRMAQLIATGRVAPEKLITHRYHGMEQIPEAMGLFLNHDRSLIKPVIYND